MSDKRIIDLEESTKIESGDYLAIDSNAGGTCKANAGIITDQFSDMQNVLGSKNELPNTAESKVDHGLTFTVNSDGSVKVNGTATADTYYTIGEVTLKAGTYILSGCYAGGGISNWRIYIFNNSGGATIASDYGNGVEFTLAVDTKVTASILVMNTKSLSNAMFYPMIRPAAVADSTYVPYAKTNKELTDDVASINDALNNKENKANIATHHLKCVYNSQYILSQLIPNYDSDMRYVGTIKYGGTTNANNSFSSLAILGDLVRVISGSGLFQTTDYIYVDVIGIKE